MFRVPDNRPNDRTTKGEQPYQDDRERFSQGEADEQEDAQLDEQNPDESAAGTRRRLEREASERFDEIAEENRSRN